MAHHNKKLTFAIIVICQFACSVCYAEQRGNDQRSYGIYKNSKYEYSICYPKDIFVPQGESDAGDGQVFLSKDGSELRVYASYNVLDETISEDFQRTTSEDKDNITYKLIKHDWYVVSGNDHDKVFYQKTLLNGDEFISFRITYASLLANIYGDIINHLNKCVRHF
jgi:hypothetical protein